MLIEESCCTGLCWNIIVASSNAQDDYSKNACIEYHTTIGLKGRRIKEDQHCKHFLICEFCCQGRYVLNFDSVAKDCTKVYVGAECI